MRRFLLAAAALALSAACGPKKYVLLSPEDDYSDDPGLTLQVEEVLETEPGRTQVTALLQNKGASPLAFGAAEVVLLDATEKAMPVLSKPAETVEPGQEKTLRWSFDTSSAAKGAFEMRLAFEGRKIWPILFSQQKPADFKQGPEDPGGPPGGPGGPGRPPF